jgi:hypothetical protein
VGTDRAVADPRSAREAVRAALASAELEWEQPDDDTFVVELPGERKLKTVCSLVVGDHSLSVNAFVVRRPDENAERVYRWLLERNARAYGLAYAIDPLGDVYLVGRLPVQAVTEAEVDRLLGAVHELADGAFNTLLELGFSSAIRKEWEWRTSRGESTANLAAFRHLAPTSTDATRDEVG